MENDVKKILLLGDAIDGMALADLWNEWNNGAETFRVKSAPEIENSAEILVIGQDALSAMTPELGRAVREYVERGGFCWIWHQDERARVEWLPETLRGIAPEPRYLRLDPNLKYNYLTPWITDRAHPVWNQPHYLDEGRFVFWDVTVEGKRYESTASHVLRQKNWNVLGRFVNRAVRPEENVALIAEAEHGKGRFFWTQTFSPQSLRKAPFDIHYPEVLFIRETWRMLAENVLHYAEGMKRDRLFTAEVRSSSWAVASGENVMLEVVPKGACGVCLEQAELLTPEGKTETVALPENGCLKLKCRGVTGGTYRVRVILSDSSGRHAAAHTFFKVSERWTPFRFMTHVHYEESTSPDSLGAIFGQARRLGIDGIILGVIREVSDPASLLASVDHPAVRFFMGQEMHSGLTVVPLPEDCPPENPDYRRHCTTFRHKRYLQWSREDWEPSNLENVHADGALAIVAHPYMSRWWLKPQNGHRFEAVEFDRLDTTIWDEVLKTGELVTGVSGIDNLGHTWFAMRGPNIGWFDAPFNEENLFRVILSGRVTRMNTFPLPLQAVGSELWFDIDGQLPGGTIYASGHVRLHARIRSHLPVEQLFIIKDGDRSGLLTNFQLRDEPDEARYEKNSTIEIDGCGYFRLEINHDKFYHPLCVTSLSNPVFYRKVAGPAGASFFFLNDAPPRYNVEKHRFYPDFTRVGEVGYRENEWTIQLDEPSPQGGELHVTWADLRAVRLDGRETAFGPEREERWKIVFPPGHHQVTLSGRNSK